MTNEQLIKSAFYLAKSRSEKQQKGTTDFISFCPKNGQINISRHLARSMNFMSGDRIAVIGNEKNEYVWLIYKTRQFKGTSEVRISSGNYTANDKHVTRLIGKPFRFTEDSQKRVKLYVNTENPLPMNMFGEKVTAFQLFDVPIMRDDFLLGMDKEDYVRCMEGVRYIIKKQITENGDKGQSSITLDSEG